MRLLRFIWHLGWKRGWRNWQMDRMVREDPEFARERMLEFRSKARAGDTAAGNFADLLEVHLSSVPPAKPGGVA